MKKIFFMLVCLISMGLIFAGCGNSKTDVTKMTAEEVVTALKKTVTTIDNIIVYTADTDPNKLLGKSNQYTSKLNFADNRVEQPDKSSPVGGTVEIFANESDCTTRKEYVKKVQEAFPVSGVDYIYQYKNVMLRISDKLTSDQAKEYETAFSSLQ